MPRVAAFVSPHGYGHAARSCAILEALIRHRPGVEIDLYTLVPEWFFASSLPQGFDYLATRSDVGLVQLSPVKEDLTATVAALRRFVPFPTTRLDELAHRLRDRDTTLVLCDISPLGLAAARRAGIPSVLVENFTWDWIYEGYLESEPALREAAALLAEHFATADHRIETEPVCDPREGAALRTAPVSRRRRSSREETRSRLGIPSDAPAALLTMGGIRGSYPLLDRLREHPGLFVVVPGACESGLEREGRLLRLPHHSSFFHPDLVGAVDVVVGKLGYSTVAEAWAAGCAMAWIGRPAFRESPVLGRFVSQSLPSEEISPEAFTSGGWIEVAERLAQPTAVPPTRENGAEAAARYLASLLG